MSNISIIRTAPAARLRAAARAGAVAAAAGVPLLAASAALAADNTNNRYQGEDSGTGLSVLQTLGIYVGIPVGLFLLITFLVVLPGWVKGDRDRKAVGWSERGVSAGPADAGDPVGAGRTSETGGASGSW